MSIASDGYVSVPMCVDAKTLDALRAEADYLFNLKHEKDAPDEDDYFEKGCTLDFFTARDLTEDDRARTSMTKYMSRRNNGNRHLRGKGPLLSTAGAGQKPATDQGKALTSTDDERGTATDGWSEHHASTVQGAIFQTLARLAMDALAAHRSARENINPRNSQRASNNNPAPNPSSCGFDGAIATAAGAEPSPYHANVNPFATPTFFGVPPSNHSIADRCGSAECEPPVSGVKRSRCFDEREQASKTLSTSVALQDRGAMATSLFLFNEQYVVKPPKSSIEFGWHTASTETIPES